MKTFKILTIIAVTGLTATMAQNSKAYDDSNHPCQMQRGDGSHSHMQKKRFNRNSNKRLNRMLRTLNLSDEQKTQLRDIRQSARQANRTKRQEAKGLASLKKFISVDGFDKSGFTVLAESKSRDMIGTRADMLEKVINILTPEQRIELVEKLGKRRGQKRNQ